MLRVGLTGGIGSGKSEVSRRLGEHGAVVIDADLLAREALTPGSDGLAEVVTVFGSDVLRADGSLDRRRLGRQVFADEGARRRLEAIVHPRVRAAAAAAEASASGDAVVVHDVPLLVETGRAGDYDLVVVVDVPEEVQVARLVARGMSAEDARDRIRAQADRASRLAAADVVVDNRVSLDDLDSAVGELWQQLLGWRR